MKMEQYSRVTLIFAIIFVCKLKATLSQQCKPFKINKNHTGKRMEGHTILNITDTRIQECAKKCFLLNHCLSINYESVSKICELNRNTSADALTDVAEQETFILSDLSTWPEEMTGTCSDKPCNGRDICFPAGNTFLCHDSDCPDAPNVEGNTATGSVEIGGIMKYKCTKLSHRIVGQGNIQCGWLNSWSNAVFTCNVVTSCVDLKLCDPTLVDGTYWIYPVVLPGEKIKVYCHNMAGTPTEYLTVNPSSNDVYIGWVSGITVFATFNRIRLVIESMTIAQNDLTFTAMSTTGDISSLTIAYGVGMSCDCYYCAWQNGYFHIDTTNTGLIIDTSVTWIANGDNPIQHDFVRSNDGRTITAHGGGTCGWTEPVSPLVMQVNSNEVIEDTEAAFVDCV